MFVESYMDESGIHDDAKLCTVAGYYGTQVAWKKFEQEWRRVLRDHDMEETGFHAKNFFRRKDGKHVAPPYSDWSEDRRRQFIDRLVQAIVRNRIFPFGHGVVVPHWNALSLDARKLMTGALHKNGRFTTSGSPDRSYYLPFMFCITDSIRNSGASEKVHFFAGLDKSFSDYAKDLYAQVCADKSVSIHHLLGTIAFPLSKDTPQLQAADLLAHRLYRHNMARMKGETRMLPITKLLLKNARPTQGFELFHLKRLLELLDEYKAVARASSGGIPNIPDL